VKAVNIPAGGAAAILTGAGSVHGSLTPISFSASTWSWYSAPGRRLVSVKLVLRWSTLATRVQCVAAASRRSMT